MKFFRAPLTVAIMLFVFQGCASMPTATEMKETLMTAAERYWNLRMEGKYRDTYKMEDRDGLLPFEDYQTKAGLVNKFPVVSHSVGEIEIEGNKGTVNVEVRVMLPNIPTTVSTVMNDKWIFKGGKWLHRFPVK